MDLQERCFSGDQSRIEEYRGKTWSLYFLGHLKEKLIESLGGRDIGIDPFVYSHGREPDTFLYFGRSKLPAYLEINQDGLLNLKVNLEGLTVEEKEERIKKAQTCHQNLLEDYDPVSKTRRLNPRAKIKTIMSFDAGLVRQDGNLFYSSAQAETISRLSEILERFYGEPPFEANDVDLTIHPPNY